MRFLFTCGGTAGHINPALGVAGRLKEIMPDASFLFIGATDMMEEKLVPRAGYNIKTVRITNVRRGFKPADFMHNLKTVRNVLKSIPAAKKMIREFRPDVAIGTGGYVCYPVLRAAHALGIPTAVHESNAVPGLTTKMLEGSVDRIMVGFEEARRNYHSPGKVTATGTPVRADFRTYETGRAKAELGVPKDRPLVVSVWGSLGAGRMNAVMVDFIQRCSRRPAFGLIHSAGSKHYEKMHDELASRSLTGLSAQGIEVRDYIYDMPRVMSAADLVLCRAGASTLAELAILGKPAILVPSPNVTNNHQEKNARVLEKAGAALVLTENGLTADALFGAVTALLQDKEKLKSMSGAMSGMGAPDATDQIVDIILELAGR